MCHRPTAHDIRLLEDFALELGQKIHYTENQKKEYSHERLYQFAAIYLFHRPALIRGHKIILILWGK